MSKSYTVSKDNDNGELKVLFTVHTEGLEMELYHLKTTSKNQSLMWFVAVKGTSAAEIAAFIERWVPTCPDVALLNEALEELNTQIPEGIL